MGNHEDMTNALKTLADRLEYVRDACEYPEWSQLARALGVTAQAVQNWRNRQAIGPANRKKLREVTGVSIEWLESGTGEPFPHGAKAYVGQVSPGAAAIIRRNSDAVDQLRAVALALIDALSATRPGVAGELAENLAHMVHGDAARQAFHERLMKDLQDRAHTESLHPPRSGKPGSSPHKRAS